MKNILENKKIETRYSSIYLNNINNIDYSKTRTQLHLAEL